MAPAATAPTAAPAASRYNLVGVVAGRIRAGAALISVDGQEAKPVRVGTLVDNEMVLESVNGRQAVLSSSTVPSSKLTLEMPKLTQ
jgi:general secretion pathway protein C